ncbi:PEP-CTERM sorting domain-containing protein [Nostoc sp. UHCC 0702]|nr:PEP-CTERM sorting domain-containing protein [Nostoc sp. UHCC 0702]
MTIFAVKKNVVKAFSVVAFTAVTAGTLSTEQAQALVLTFDDLPLLTADEAYYDLIPNEYGGLNWDNFYYLNSSSEDYESSGYAYGTASTPNVAFNGGANPALVTTVNNNGGHFDFNSAYLTAAWNNGLNILVEGFLDGIVKYSTTVTVDAVSPTLFNFDFLGIDNLSFTSYGGVDAGYSGEGEQFILDNLTYEYKAVPEPATILGLLTVASFGLSLRRQQKQQ